MTMIRCPECEKIININSIDKCPNCKENIARIIINEEKDNLAFIYSTFALYPLQAIFYSFAYFLILTFIVGIGLKMSGNLSLEMFILIYSSIAILSLIYIVYEISTGGSKLFSIIKNNPKKYNSNCS